MLAQAGAERWRVVDATHVDGKQACVHGRAIAGQHAEGFTGRALEAFQRRVVGHETVCTTAAVEVQRAVLTHFFGVVADTIDQVDFVDLTAELEAQGVAITVTARELARGGVEAVVAEGVAVAQCRQGREHGGVVEALDLHLQRLRGAQAAVARTQAEDVAAVGLECLDGRIVGHIHIGTRGGLDVKRAKSAGQTGGIGAAADGVAASSLTSDAVVQHRIVVRVAAHQRAGHRAEAVVGRGVGQGDDGGHSQGRLIVRACDGQRDGGAAALGRCACVGGGDGVSQHQRLAVGQEVEQLRAAVEAPAHGTGGAGGVAQQVARTQVQHGQQVGGAGQVGCHGRGGATDHHGLAQVDGIAQAAVGHAQAAAGGQAGAVAGHCDGVATTTEGGHRVCAHNPGGKGRAGAQRAVAGGEAEAVGRGDASGLGFNGRFVGHIGVGARGAVEVKRSEQARFAQVVAGQGVVRRRASQAIAERGAVAAVGAGQRADDGQQVVIARCVDEVGAGLAEIEHRGVGCSHQRHRQGLTGGGAAAVGDGEGEVFCGVAAGQGVDRGIIGHEVIGAGAAVEVQGAIQATHAAVVATAAGICGGGRGGGAVQGDAVSGHIAAVAVAAGQAANGIGKPVLGRGVGARDGAQWGQRRGVVAAVQGEGDRC